MNDYTATETCSCGASFTMRSGYASYLDDAITKFRADHHHEMPPIPEPVDDVRTVDHIGTHHEAGGTEMGLGFYPPAGQEIGDE